MPEVERKTGERRTGSKRWVEWAALVGFSAASGALLFVSDHPCHLPAVQAVALLPLFYGLIRYSTNHRRGAAAGFVVGSCFIVPLSVTLEFPILFAVGLGAYLVVLWTLMTLGFSWVLRRCRSPWAGLACGSIAVVIEWVDFTVVPIWGTAQSFVRVWSAYPGAVQFVSLTGMLGLVFVVVSLQALFVKAVLEPSARKVSSIVLSGLAAAVTVYDVASWARDLETGPKVGAMGWTYEQLTERGIDRSDSSSLYSEMFLPLFEEAARKGASLVVTPEVAFYLEEGERDELFSKLASLTRRYNVALAVGYMDRAQRKNQVAFFSARGKLVGTYTKTHLIYYFEDYEAGDGTLLVAALEHRAGGELDTVRLGFLICQDDNFTDLARAYGRRGVELLVDPTNDWEQVKKYHFENVIFRALENRYGLVRAASNGISAIVSPAGEVLESMDHARSGPGVIVSPIEVDESETIYSHAGDWPMLAAALALLLLSFFHRDRPERREKRAPKHRAPQDRARQDRAPNHRARQDRAWREGQSFD